MRLAGKIFSKMNYMYTSIAAVQTASVICLTVSYFVLDAVCRSSHCISFWCSVLCRNVLFANMDTLLVITSEEVRRCTGQEMLETIIWRRRLSWLGPGHLVCRALRWISLELQKKHGRPRTNWKKTLNKDLNVIDLTWSETTELTEDCNEWHSSAAWCAVRRHD